MNEFLLIGADYLKGKSIYNPLRRALNLLLNISIASFIYETAYGPYTWLSIGDYKAILDFFIKGLFFIPLSIFVAVYAVTQSVSIILFISLTTFKTMKWTRAIIEYEVKKESVEENLENVAVVSDRLGAMKLPKEALVGLYTHLRSAVKPEDWQKLHQALDVPKNNLEATFHLAFRMVVSITIYFLTLPSFGWFLYVLTFLVLIFGMYLLVLGYRLLDIFPTIVRKFKTVAEDYLAEHYPNLTEDSKATSSLGFKMKNNQPG